MTGILEVKMGILQGGETHNTLQSSKASVTTDDLDPLTKLCRKHHSLAFQIPLLILKCTRAASSPDH